MKRFQFRLETLLKIRIREEEQAQMALSAAIEELAVSQQQLSALQNVLEQTFLNFPTKNKQLTINELQFYHSYINNLKTQIAQQQQIVQAATAKKDECLTVFEEAAKKRKLVEKLKAKRLQEYQVEMLQEEQKFLDDLAGQISSRKQGDER